MLISMGLTPVIIMLTRRLKVADIPDIRKVHKKPIPRIGGVPIFISTMFLVIPVLFLSNTIGEKFRDILPQVIVLLSAGTFIFLVGLVDDIKGLRARFKLLAQLAAAIAICAAGIRIDSVRIADWLILDFGWFSWPLTIFWIVGVTNAVNIIDGLDGLAAGISAITCGVIAVLAVHFGQPVMAVLMLAVLGSLTGFLFFNFNPARIFMGDSGSMFLGFVLASSSVMCAAKSQALVGLALPVVALGIPIFDTLFSMLRRFLERRSIFAADRSHFHHRLLDLGLKQRHVVIVMYIVTLLAAGLGMFMMATRQLNTIVAFACILLLLVIVFRIVGSVRLRETIAGLREKYAVTRQKNEETRCFEAAQLHFRQAVTFDQWWQAVCLAAEKMDFARLKLPLNGDNDPAHTLTWSRSMTADSRSLIADEIMKMKIPIHEIKAGQGCSLEVDVNVNGSLESAGRRLALFTRLMEENGIVLLK